MQIFRSSSEESNNDANTEAAPYLTEDERQEKARRIAPVTVIGAIRESGWAKREKAIAPPAVAEAIQSD